MDKYHDKYRISSSRASWWNYGWDAAYFITICTKNKAYFFGELEDGKMNLSRQGIVADILWWEIKSHIKFIELGEFVIMPNHIRGILILNRTDDVADKDVMKERKENVSLESNILSYEQRDKDTLHATSLQIPPSPEKPSKNVKMSDLAPKANTISTIIRSYKSAVSRHIHRLGFEFEWQARFHDRIIRNEEEYLKISNYIKHNPQNWNEDRYR